MLRLARTMSMVAALGAATGFSLAQSIEFRLIERTGRVYVTGPADNQLNLAVQAREVGGIPTTCISQWGFNIHIVGEPEASGTLTRCLINNPDRTYTLNIAANNAVGTGGMAAQYTWLAAINASFNGVINQSSGTFTNTPDQEIGLITAQAGGSALLGTPGVDDDGDGNPDTWFGNGSGAMPQQGIDAPLTTNVTIPYFGSGGRWIDVYRFRYTTTNYTTRTLRFRLDGTTAGTSFRYVYGMAGPWGLGDITTVPTTSFDLLIGVGSAVAAACCSPAGACSVVFPANCVGTYTGVSSCTPTPCDPPGACCDPIAVGCTLTTPATCTGTFFRVSTCTPTPCPPPGRCCGPGYSCLLVVPTACPAQNTSFSTFIAGTTCSPNPCTPFGACCDDLGACTLVEDSDCDFTWTQGITCSPPPCPPLGRCCFNGACSLSTQPWCATSSWTVGESCSPNPCPPLGNCCYFTGACSRQLQAFCFSGTWLPGASCTPTPCPPVGQCCTSLGSCSLLTQPGCTGAWFAGAVCSPNPCPQRGVCCTSGACTFVLQSLCPGNWAPQSLSCTTGICTQIGACCLGHACTFSTAANCSTAQGRTFQGAGSICGIPANPIACCPANFNRLNGLEIPDIFDFLSAWFLSDPATDFDHNGSLNPTDVLEFLSAWFAGC